MQNVTEQLLCVCDRVEARDERGNTALSVAAWKNHIELAEMMIDEFKAKVNSRDSKMWTPISIAAFHGHADMVRFLLDVRCLLYLFKKHYAHSMYQHGANPQLRNSYNKNALDLCTDDKIAVLLAGESATDPLISEDKIEATEESEPVSSKKKAKKKKAVGASKKKPGTAKKVLKKKKKVPSQQK